MSESSKKHGMKEKIIIKKKNYNNNNLRMKIALSGETVEVID